MGAAVRRARSATEGSCAQWAGARVRCACPPRLCANGSTPGHHFIERLCDAMYSLVGMHRLAATVVLIAVSVNAMWCVDGCIDPFASKTPVSSLATSTSSDTPDVSTCVVCVTPFQKEQSAVLVPVWGLGFVMPVFRAVGPPLPPRARIEHPPRAV